MPPKRKPRGGGVRAATRSSKRKAVAIPSPSPSPSPPPRPAVEDSDSETGQENVKVSLKSQVPSATTVTTPPQPLVTPSKVAPVSVTPIPTTPVTPGNFVTSEKNNQRLKTHI